jgi:excinuclease ABC subunit B
MQNQVIYVSATPADYELQKTDGVVVEQVVGHDLATVVIFPVVEGYSTTRIIEASR